MMRRYVKTKLPTLEAPAKLFSKEEFAIELGVSVANLNQILINGVKKNLFPEPVIRKNGRQNLYTQEFVNTVKDTRKSKAVKNVSANKYSVLTVKLPIYDKNLSEFLLAKFKDEEGIINFLRDKLNEIYQPHQNMLAALEEEYQKKKQRIISGESTV